MTASYTTTRDATAGPLGLALFTVAATAMFHQFWASPLPQVVPQTINFLKNLGLIGCLGLIAAFGAGPYRVGGAWRGLALPRDRA